MQDKEGNITAFKDTKQVIGFLGFMEVKNRGTFIVSVRRRDGNESEQRIEDKSEVEKFLKFSKESSC